MTRIFGGKSRSTLKVPGQKDSAVLEDWRSLKLDIEVNRPISITAGIADWRCSVMMSVLWKMLFDTYLNLSRFK